jgi:cellulose synthase/poly-beta-1,6-N-acetylglucosamine synthase-like glycosyltransferase
MNTGWQILLWTSLALVAYAYVGYALVIFVSSRLFGRPPQAPELESSELPHVSLLISALDEEEVIGARVANALAQDYPADRLDIVIASDGSRDQTASIVGEFATRHPSRVKILDYPRRRGKSTVLNASLPGVRGDIVVLSDANTDFDRMAIRNLVRWFKDPEVGAVCGQLILVDETTGRNVDGLYWRYENFLKECEGRLGALLGSNGAIYAIRRSSYVPIPSDTIVDDLVIPLTIKLQRQQKIVFDRTAVATEPTAADVRAEFRRRSRIGAGGFQSVARLWQLMLPGNGWTSLAFLSHKVLRWVGPAFLLLALVSNLMLIGQPLYQFMLACQVCFYAAASVGIVLPGNSKAVRIVRLATMFTSMNVALAVGFYCWISGLQRGTWQRTSRGMSGPGPRWSVVVKK